MARRTKRRTAKPLISAARTTTLEEELDSTRITLEVGARAVLDALEAELRTLPISPQAKSGGLYATTIPAIARELMLLARDVKAATPGQRSRLARSLQRTLRALAPVSHEDIGYARSELARVRSQLMRLHAAVKAKGTPRKVGVRRLTRATAIHYRRLTGRRPTVVITHGIAGGSWLDHLHAIFAILGVDALAEVQSRTHLPKRKKDQREAPTKGPLVE